MVPLGELLHREMLLIYLAIMAVLYALTVLQAPAWRCMSAAPIAVLPFPVLWVVWNRPGLGRQSERLLKQAVRRVSRSPW